MNNHRGLPQYGIDKELQARAMLKYDPQLEAEAREWIETLIGEKLPTGKSFCESLKSGVQLCKVVNKIKPGSIKKINNMQIPFKEMENISNYLAVAKDLGVGDADSFMTVDLYEGKDVNQVIQNIHALGRASRGIPTFGGPYIGAKVAEKQASKFTEEQIRASRNEVPLLTGAMHSLKVDNTLRHRDIVNGPQGSPSYGGVTTKFDEEMRKVASPFQQDTTRNITKAGAAPPCTNTSTTKFDEEMRKVQGSFQTDNSRNIVKGSGGVNPDAGLSYMDAQMRNMPTASTAGNFRNIVKPGSESQQARRSSTEIGNLEYLEKLAKMRDSGIVSEEEFQAKKKELLGL